MSILKTTRTKKLHFNKILTNKMKLFFLFSFIFYFSHTTKSFSPLLFETLNRDQLPQTSEICNIENKCFLMNVYKTYFPILRETSKRQIGKLSLRKIAVFETDLSIFGLPPNKMLGQNFLVCQLFFL